MARRFLYATGLPFHHRDRVMQVDRKGWVANSDGRLAKLAQHGHQRLRWFSVRQQSKEVQLCPRLLLNVRRGMRQADGVLQMQGSLVEIALSLRSESKHDFCSRLQCGRQTLAAVGDDASRLVVACVEQRPCDEQPVLWPLEP